MKKLKCYLMVAIIAVSCLSATLSFADDPIRKIAFGSCIKQDQPMPILSTIADEKPDVTIFLGDNIYADTHDMQLMRLKYETLGRDLNFQKLLSQSKLLATWDDHDFGINDGGADYTERDLAQQEFIKFWELPAGSPIRKRPGVYDAKVFGDDGQRVQIILLDTRYFRSPLKKGLQRRVGGPYIPDHDPQKTMLGEAQWKWLEEQLLQPAEIRILASSIQCVASDAGQETWSNLPHERERLFSLIKETKAEGVMIISGDRHWAEFSRTTEIDLPYPCYDFTSSSFNQIHPRGTPTENKHRSSDTTYHKENYGIININWNQSDPTIEVKIKDLQGQTQVIEKLQVSELRSH